MSKLDNRRGIDLYREMLLIRRFEEEAEARFRAGELHGYLNLSLGHEAVAVGVCRALDAGDVIASTHRADAHALAKGMHPNELMAELYGKAEGCSGGYGGSMHLYDLARGNLGANAVVGGGLPGIVGAALSFQLRGEPRVAVGFLGEGATSTGAFHEALNLAAVWRVPALFVCESNGRAGWTASSSQIPVADLAQRAGAYGLPAVTVDGSDVEAVLEVTRQAAAHARGGHGPVFLVAKVRRLGGAGDREAGSSGVPDDPLERLRGLLALGVGELDELEREVGALVAGAVAFARAGTDPRPEDALRNVYA